MPDDDELQDEGFQDRMEYKDGDLLIVEDPRKRPAADDEPKPKRKGKFSNDDEQS